MPSIPLLTGKAVTHCVSRRGREISLTAREFGLLEYFFRNQGQVITRSMAEGHLWNQEEPVASNVADVYVRCLRAKIDEGFEPKLLETLRGCGYRLRIHERNTIWNEEEKLKRELVSKEETLLENNIRNDPKRIAEIIDAIGKGDGPLRGLQALAVYWRKSSQE